MWMALHVDLSLAVNYLPACACLGKVLVCMLGISMIPPRNEVDGLLIIAAMLYIDRMITRNIIFDANAILLAIFFANVHATVRAISTQHAFRILVDGMFLFWACGSLLLLGEPHVVKKAVERTPAAARIVPVVLMLIIVVAMSHVHEPLEAGGARACRAVAFTLLAFAWIYIVGVHAPTGIEYLKENSCQFVARLAPVLYATPWVAVLFTFGAVAAFATQYMRLLTPMPVLPTSRPPDTASFPPEPPQLHQPLAPSNPAVPDDTEELFRMARMQAVRKLETIHEAL